MRYGVLGKNARKVIPSCFVWAIRDSFPDPNGQYHGFEEAEEDAMGNIFLDLPDLPGRADDDDV